LKVLRLNLFAIIALSLVPSTASAATVQFTTTVDLATCPSLGCTKPFTPGVSIAIGDLVDFTVLFDSQRAFMTDLAGGSVFEGFRGWLAAGDNDSGFTISNASIQLLGLIGTLNSPLAKPTETSGQAHLGPLFSGDFIATGSTISFTGYRVLFTVDALEVSPHAYSSIWMGFSADQVQFAPEATVPEPASLLLLGAGLAGVAARRRRKPSRRT
jgi:hypothetical protein